MPRRGRQRRPRHEPAGPPQGRIPACAARRHTSDPAGPSQGRIPECAARRHTPDDAALHGLGRPPVVGQDHGVDRPRRRLRGARAGRADLQEGPRLHRPDVAGAGQRPALPEPRQLPDGRGRCPCGLRDAGRCGRSGAGRRQYGAARRRVAGRQRQQCRAGPPASPAGRAGDRHARHDARRGAADPRIPGLRPEHPHRRRDPEPRRRRAP